MRILEESIKQVLAHTDIVEVVSDFVVLKKKGANYAALSPFVSEKTPSFYVSPSKQIFKCFSSGIGGDAIRFLMEIDKLTYAEAIKYLAKKYNIELQYDKQQTEEQRALQQEKDSLFILLEFAKNYYKQQLYTEEGRGVALSYFKERGLTENTIEVFELGYAPEGWQNLFQEVIKHQFNTQHLERTGLVKINEKGGYFDFFRQRVIFPIHNPSGKVVALAGRIMTSEKSTAKYINSPETDLYSKSQVLYGLFQAKNAIRAANQVLLVEGYMDVISLYQAGIKNVVASSGTSLTKEQAQLISRYTNHVTILYDGDAAGIKAAIRGADVLLETGLRIRVLVLPDGHDPDSYIKSYGAETFKNYLKQNTKDFISFKTEILLKDNADDPIKKAEVINDVVQSIAKVKDSIERSLYFSKCSALLGIEEQTIISEYNKIQYNQLKKREEHLPDYAWKDLSASDRHAVQQDSIMFNSLSAEELAERELIRIVLEYARVELSEVAIPIWQWVQPYLENIQFKNKIYERILTIFKEEVGKGNTPGIDFFLLNPDPEIEKELITIFTDRHEKSEQWEKKFNIFLPDKDEEKETLAKKALARLNFEKVRLRLIENMQRLKNGVSSEDEEYEILERYKIMKAYQIGYAKEIGMVISA